MLNNYAKQIVNNILNKECYYNKEYECYETDIYVDYRDTLNNEDIKKILKCDTEDIFLEIINEYYIGAEQDIIDCINDKCCNLLDKAKVDFATGEISNISGKIPTGEDNNTVISDSVSTPVVYKGKIYFVGSNGWGQPGKLCIVNSDDLSQNKNYF